MSFPEVPPFPVYRPAQLYSLGIRIETEWLYIDTATCHFKWRLVELILLLEGGISLLLTTLNTTISTPACPALEVILL